MHSAQDDEIENYDDDFPEDPDISIANSNSAVSEQVGEQSPIHEEPEELEDNHVEDKAKEPSPEPDSIIEAPTNPVLVVEPETPVTAEFNVKAVDEAVAEPVPAESHEQDADNVDPAAVDHTPDAAVVEAEGETTKDEAAKEESAAIDESGQEKKEPGSQSPKVKSGDDLEEEVQMLQGASLGLRHHILKESGVKDAEDIDEIPDEE
jgi:hypothetical protein